MQFDTKIAVVVRSDLESWQKLNVASFLAGGIAAAFPECIGDAYEDGSGTKYLSLIGQPILIYGADGPALSRALERALARNNTPALYTEDMFKTTHDAANREVVKAVARTDLNLVGLAMRAAAFNPVSSRLVGVRVGWMLALGWGLAAAIGAVGGMMVAPIVYLDPNMMAGILLYAFAGALLGGIDNPLGAVLGGFAVGIIENLAGAYLVGTELKLTVALIIIVAVLVVKPSGLFGRTVLSRV